MIMGLEGVPSDLMDLRCRTASHHWIEHARCAVPMLHARDESLSVSDSKILGLVTETWSLVGSEPKFSPLLWEYFYVELLQSYILSKLNL